MGPPRRCGDEAERPKIVHAQDVIGVGVSIEHCVDMGQPLTQGLFAEIRSGVDHHDALNSGSRVRSSAAVRGRPQPAVARVSRLAHRALAAQRRNSHRGARAQKCERRLASASCTVDREAVDRGQFDGSPCTFDHGLPAPSWLALLLYRRWRNGLHAHHAGEFQKGHARFKEHRLQHAIFGAG